MQPELYVEAALRFIATLLLWIGVHDPGRTTELTWGEVTSNIDHAANNGDVDAAKMIVFDIGYFGFAPNWANETVGCESGWRYDAVGAGRYYSLWQVDGDIEGISDVRGHVARARVIFDRQGPSAWPLCGVNDWDYEVGRPR